MRRLVATVVQEEGPRVVEVQVRKQMAGKGHSDRVFYSDHRVQMLFLYRLTTVTLKPAECSSTQTYPT